MVYYIILYKQKTIPSAWNLLVQKTYREGVQKYGKNKYKLKNAMKDASAIHKKQKHIPSSSSASLSSSSSSSSSTRKRKHRKHRKKTRRRG